MTLPKQLAGMDAVQVPMLATKCPTCGALLDGAAIPESATDDRSGPKSGDYTICIKCREISRFDDDLQLRAPTEKDILEMPTHMLSLMQLMLDEV